MVQLPRLLGDVAVESGFDRVLLREGLDPRGQEQIQLLQRKLIQQPAQNFLNLPVRQLQTIHRHAAHAVLLLDLRRERHRPRAARLRGVQNHDEGLADLLQLADDALLGLLIVRARDLRDGLPSVVTTTPTVEWSVMTLRVPISAASVMGISWSNHGVMTMRGARSSNCPTAPGTI